jgi:hypothetical protein
MAAMGVLGLLGAAPTPASAAAVSAGPSYWVSPAGTPTGANTSCQTAAYSTVQSAVTAAEDYEALHPEFVPTVDICPGTYLEQVTIQQSLVLTAAPAPLAAPSSRPVTIQLPAVVGSGQSAGLSTTNCQADDATKDTQLPQSVIEICAAGISGANNAGVTVAVRGVTVAGPWTSTACYDSRYGILVDGGATLSLTNSIIEKIEADPLSGCQGGVGVQVGFAPTGQIGHANLTGDTIEGYQKNGITVDGPGSTADISRVVVTGAGPTSVIAQNGIQFSYGATGSVTASTITGNNYLGKNGSSAAGILAFGGGGAKCGLGANSPLVKRARFTGNRLDGNDMGIALANYDPTCTKSPATPTGDLACGNVIEDSHGYGGGVASADANISGYSTAPVVGYQAGISDIGNHDVICDNTISGAGYAPLDAASSLPKPTAPAFVRPIDVLSGPAIAPLVYGNLYGGSPY